MKFLHFKASALFATITLALVMSCAEEEKLTPASSVADEPIEIIVGEDRNFVSSESSDTKNSRAEIVRVKAFTVYFRYSNDFEGDLQIKLLKGTTLLSQSVIFHKKPSAVNPDQLDDAVFSVGISKDLEVGQSYTIELHCTNYSSSTSTQLYWWSSNSSVYSSGAGMRKENNILYTTNADFSFKMEALNDNGGAYVNIEQSVRQKLYQINTTKIYRQTFVPN